MTEGHGGKRTPRNPAPASGPGRLSRRTDGGPAQKLQAGTGLAYGDHKALMDQERTAPMAQADTPPAISVPQAQPAQGGGSSTGSSVPFGAPSARPDEPITHGVNIGPGGGADVLPLQQQSPTLKVGPMTQMLALLAARDQSGVLANLYQSAQAAGA